MKKKKYSSYYESPYKFMGGAYTLFNDRKNVDILGKNDGGISRALKTKIKGVK